MNVTRPILALSPGMWHILLRQSWHRRLERQAGSSVGRSRAWIAPFKRVFHDPTLTPLEAGTVRNFWAGGLWTKAHAIRRGYLLPDDRCELCRVEADSIRHRLLGCQHAEARAARQLVFEEVGGSISSILQDIRDDNELSKWACPEHPASHQPIPHLGSDLETGGDGVIFWGADGRSIDQCFRGCHPIFTDGSCSVAPATELKRAGWAMCEIDQSGRILATLSGPLWATIGKQTSGQAELAAIDAALQCSPAPSICTDYASALRLAASVSDRAFLSRSTTGGLVRHWQWQQGWANAKLRKVKAHVNPDGLIGEEWLEAVGNQHADQLAKEAAARHPPLDKPRLKECLAAGAIAEAIFKLAAKLLPLWPALERSPRVQETERPPPLVRPSEGRKHRWSHSQVWRCLDCLRTARTPGSKAGMDSHPCRGPPEWLSQLAVDQAGHKLLIYAAEDESTFVICCTACCRWAQGEVGKPLFCDVRCKGSPTSPSAEAVKRNLDRGFHPKRGDKRYRYSFHSYAPPIHLKEVLEHLA